jgi:hypothetical protein
MFRRVIVIGCLFCLTISRGRAQDPGEEIFSAVIKSLEVLEKAFSESFELEMTRNQTRRSETLFPSLKSRDQDSEAIRLCRVLKSKTNEEFCLAASSGYNELTIKPGGNSSDAGEKSSEKVDYRELSDAHFIYGKNAETVSGRLSQDDVSIRRGTLLEKLDYTFALECGCKFPIIQITEHSNTVTNYLDPLIDFCNDRQNQNRITKTEEDGKEGKVIVYRVKHHPEPDQVFAQKIVVSDSGFDKGLIRENSIGLLRQSQFNLPYTSEKQISSELITSVKVQWKETSFGDVPDERIIVPERVAKSSSVLRSVKATKSDITQFSWKPLSEEAKKKISLEEAKKTTEEQLKTINKMLKR